MGAWREVSIYNPAATPACPGLYCVYVDKKLCYIGKAKNLRVRTKAHQLHAFKDFRIWRSVRGMDCRLKVRPLIGTPKQLAALERGLIKRLQPYVNTLDSGRPKRGERIHRLAFASDMHLQYG